MTQLFPTSWGWSSDGGRGIIMERVAEICRRSFPLWTGPMANIWEHVFYNQQSNALNVLTVRLNAWLPWPGSTEGSRVWMLSSISISPVVPVAWARRDIFFCYFLVLESRGKIHLLSQRRIIEKNNFFFLGSIIELFTNTLLQITLCAIWRGHGGKEDTILTLKKFSLGTGSGSVRGVEKFFGSKLVGEMSAVYRSHLSFPTGGGHLGWALKYRISPINSVGGEEALKVFGTNLHIIVADVNFQVAGARKNEVWGEGWSRTEGR